MDAANALIVSQAVIANRVAEAREHGLARRRRSTKRRNRIPLIQLLSPVGRLTPRPA